MTPLRRHQLAYLSADGWSAVRAREWDAEACACLRYWDSSRLPLVVTRQLGDESVVALGLPAPVVWNRRRIALQVPRESVVYFDAFPRAAEVLTLLSREARTPWRALMGALAVLDAPARVYGGYGWQKLTGLRYLHADSDLDLWVAVDDAAHADAVAACLAAFAVPRLRLDGELVFGDGSAVHWREWAAWRAGQARRLLVKRLDGAVLASPGFQAEAAWAMELAA